MKKIKLIIKRAFSLLNRIVVKNKKLVFMIGSTGYRDNLKAVCEYMINNSYTKKYKIRVYVPKEFYKKEDCNPKIKFVHSKILMHIYILISKYVFYNHAQIGVKPSKNQTVIHMWHGSPLKKIGNLESGVEKDNCYFTKIFATSEFFKPIMSQAFSCPLEKVILCGQPKCDILFKNNKKPNLIQDNKFIFWVPTYRKSIFNRGDDGALKNIIPIFLKNDYYELNQKLKELNIVLLVKLHPAEKMDDTVMTEMSNLYLYGHEQFASKGYELYSIASNADAVISDYSSFYLEFLLLDRPVAFTLEDVEKYKDNRGFVMDNPLDFMPGNKIFSKEEFYAFIEDIAKGVDNYKEERKRVNDIVNYYKDDNNCKRALEIAGINKDN